MNLLLINQDFAADNYQYEDHTPRVDLEDAYGNLSQTDNQEDQDLQDALNEIPPLGNDFTIREGEALLLREGEENLESPAKEDNAQNKKVPSGVDDCCLYDQSEEKRKVNKSLAEYVISAKSGYQDKDPKIVDNRYSSLCKYLEHQNHKQPPTTSDS